MIAIDHLTYSYRRGFIAINDATATIQPGIHLLLGENGAGKTTLLRLIAGLLFPTSGTVSIDDCMMNNRVPSTLKKVFMLPDTMEIPASTIRAFAGMHSRFYPTFSQESFEENLREFNLSGHEVFGQLSLGLRHKSLLAYAIALGVDVLLLDEPANGLDIDSKKALRNMLARCTTEEQTVIISTHTVSDLRELYDGLIMLSRGQLLISRPTWEIAERISCVASAIPPADAIFTEQGPGIFHSIVANTGNNDSDLNYALLYSALMSPARETLLKHLNSCQQPTSSL